MPSQDRLPTSRRTALGLLLGVAGLVLPQASTRGDTGATLNVAVQGIRSDRGRIRIALWSSAADFTKGDLALAKDDIIAQVGEVAFSFTGLRPGPYALASYHDEDDDVTFDQTWIGLPAEGLGFSNGAWIEFGPPKFEDAKVEVGPGPQWTRISLRY